MDLVIASCVAHRKRVHLAGGEWRHPDGNPCVAADPAIGNRRCHNCGFKLFNHCHAHYIPCCPGRCPGLRIGRDMQLRGS